MRGASGGGSALKSTGAAGSLPGSSSEREGEGEGEDECGLREGEGE